MKGFFIAPVDSTSKEYIGVYKKIQYQIDAFKNLGTQMDYIGIEGNEINFVDYKEKVNLQRGKHYVFFRYILKNINTIIDRYDFIYIRYSFANPYMFAVAKKFIKNDTKVFIEIPTYPYVSEIPNSAKNIILKKVDSFLWNIKKQYVSRLVLTNDLPNLFGIQAVNIFNGISKKDIAETENALSYEEINLIAVANLSKWHGYDRIINGMYDYYKSNQCMKVRFYIIGEGIEKENLQDLSKKLELDEYVYFLGAKFGDELESLYKKANIGVSSLALFRAGGGHDPIKSKEYIAKGIPVIIGYNDRALSEKLPFVFKVASDESAINIQYIVDKYKNMNISNNEIKRYALNNLTWESQMIKILSILKK